MVQPPDPITELFDKETASSSGSPELGTREAGILYSQTETSKEQDAQFYQTHRDKTYFRTSSAFCVPDCGLALSLGAGTTLPGSPRLQKHGCWFASVPFVQIKEGLANYKWIRSGPPSSLLHCSSKQGQGFLRVSLLPALLGGNYYSHFEEEETEAQRLMLMEG